VDFPNLFYSIDISSSYPINIAECNGLRLLRITNDSKKARSIYSPMSGQHTSIKYISIACRCSINIDEVFSPECKWTNLHTVSLTANDIKGDLDLAQMPALKRLELKVKSLGSFKVNLRGKRHSLEHLRIANRRGKRYKIDDLVNLGIVVL